MRKKQPVSLSQKFPNADPLALRLLEKLLAFDPKDRPTAEEVCYGQNSFSVGSSFYSFRDAFVQIKMPFISGLSNLF